MPRGSSLVLVRGSPALVLLCLAALGLATSCGPAPSAQVAVEIARLTPRPKLLWQASPRDLVKAAPEWTVPFERSFSVDFSSPDRDRYLVSGWSSTEKNRDRSFVWSSGQTSRLELPLSRVEDLTLAFRCFPQHRRDAPPQSIDVTLNGKPLTRIELARGTREYLLHLPSSHLLAGRNAIELHYGWTAVPAEIDPSSRDDRELAVAFSRIELRAADQDVRIVSVQLADRAARSPGLLVDRPSARSYLVELRAGASLRVGGLALGPAGSEARIRIALQNDEGERVLAEEMRAPSELPRWYEFDLAADASTPVRIKLEVLELPPATQWLWVQPQLGPAEEDASSQPLVPGGSVVLIVLDAAARGRFGLYGHGAQTTPNLDALAARSLVFDRAYSQAAYTLAGTASLFTSLVPAHHDLVGKQDRLSGEVSTLAEILRSAGYATAAFSANGFVSTDFGLHQGFETFRELFREKSPGPVLGEEFLEPVMAWVEEFAAAEAEARRPFLLYLHLMQPHDPYNVAPTSFYRDLDPAYEGAVDGTHHSLLRIFNGELVPAPADLKRIRSLYDGNLRYADHAIARLLEALESGGWLDDALLVVTADHGESLGEREVFGHNWNVDDETIAIPLLVKIPGHPELRGRISSPAALIDVAPTILSAVGIDYPPEFEGNDLITLAQAGRPREPRVILAQSAHRQPLVRLETGSLRFVFDPRSGARELMRVSEAETAAVDPARRPVSFAYLENARIGLGSPAEVKAEERAPLSPEAREALRTIGYIVE